LQVQGQPRVHGKTLSKTKNLLKGASKRLS
jgi:hypothetical protein